MPSPVNNQSPTGVEFAKMSDADKTAYVNNKLSEQAVMPVLQRAIQQMKKAASEKQASMKGEEENRKR